MGVTEQEAYLNFNLAPLALRRNFAMLGFIFKCVKGLAPKRCQTLFERKASSTLHTTRFQDHRHPLQLFDPIVFHPTDILKRSVYGLVVIWNALPEEIVSRNEVKLFHTSLTIWAKEVLQGGSSIPDYGTEEHFG